MATVTEIPHSRPAAGRLVDGPATAELERRWCEMTGMGAAAAVGSGTAALRLALLALGVGPGDEVIVPAYSCVALLNAPLSIGATPVLADVEPGRWTLDRIDVARRINQRTTAIIVVNLFGDPADVAYGWAGCPVIEDCAHGPILGRTDISVSSFYATKLVGAGMGGIVSARDPELIERVRRRRDYGDQEPDGRNANDKLAERLAGAAIGELAGLHENLAQRHRIALAYSRDLAEAPLCAHLSPPSATKGRVWYRYVVLLSPNFLAAEVAARMKERGVYAEQPVWDLRACSYWREDLPVAETIFDRGLSLPLYPGLTEDEQDRVINVLREVLA